MDAILAVMTGTAGLVVGGVVLLLLIGWYVLWRPRRKLRQTT
jgi:type II secretory pathway component PulM